VADLDVALKLRLVNLLSGPAKAAAKDLAGIKTAADKLGGKGAGRFAGDLGKAWTASAKLGTSLGTVEAKARGVAKGAPAARRFAVELGKAQTASAKLGGSLGTVETKARGAAQALRHFSIDRRSIDAMRREVERLSAAYKKLADQQRRSAKQPKPGGSGRNALRDEALSRMGGNAYLLGAGRATMAGAAIGGGAAALIGGGVAATRQSISRDKAMADVKKKVNLDPGATWADVESTISKVSRDLGMAFNDTAALTAAAGQAGIEYKDLAEYMRLAAKAASGWDVAPKEAAQSLAQIKAQTQWGNQELQDFADKVNALGDASASQEKNVLEMFKRSAAAAKAANVEFDTTLAVTTALNSIGMQEEVASRFFNAFSSKMRTAGEQSEKAGEGYKMLGLSVKLVEKGMKKDSLKTMLDVLERLEKHPDKAAAAIKIFGQEWWDEATRAGQAIPEIIRLLKLIQDPKNWKGSLDKNMATELATTAKKLERVSQVVGEIGDRLGKWALPSINNALDSAIQKYDQMEERRKRSEAAKKAGENAAAGIPPTDEESRRMRDDPAFLEDVEAARKGSDQAPEKVQEHIKEIERLRTQLSELNAQFNSEAGMGFDGSAQLRNQIENRITTLETLIEATRKLPDNPPEPPKRPTDLFAAKDVDALIGKLQELDRVSRTLQLFPNDEGAKARARELVAELTATFQKADLTPAAKQVMDTYVAGLASEGGKVTAQAQSIRAQLEKILGAPIVVKITPSVSGAPAAKPSGGAGGPGGGKRSSLNRSGGGLNIQTAHFHGVKDLAGAHKQALAMADRAARGKRDGALHDVDIGDTA